MIQKKFGRAVCLTFSRISPKLRGLSRCTPPPIKKFGTQLYDKYTGARVPRKKCKLGV